MDRPSKKVTSTEQSNSAELTSGEVVGLKEFFSALVKIVSTLAGFAALFVLLGYTITLSFINNVKLYGVTAFPQEFYKEATLKFLGDMFESYGKHPFCAGAMIGIIIVITGFTYLIGKYSSIWARPSVVQAVRLFATVFVIAIVLLTLRLDVVPDSMFSVTETKKVMIFMISMPVLLAVFVIVAVRFKDYKKSAYRFYYVMVLMLGSLFVSIPVGYGDNIFDIVIFPVAGFDIEDSTKIESLLKLKKEIAAQGEGSLFFLMGHTTDREIFFDYQSLSPPAKMILIDRNLIKFLRISRGNINTLRSILQEPSGIEPFQLPKVQIKVGDLPSDIKKDIDAILPKE